MIDKLKYCRDCKHVLVAEVRNKTIVLFCTHEKVLKEFSNKYTPVMFVRGNKNLCGIHGAYYEEANLEGKENETTH